MASIGVWQEVQKDKKHRQRMRSTKVTRYKPSRDLLRVSARRYVDPN